MSRPWLIRTMTRLHRRTVSRNTRPKITHNQMSCGAFHRSGYVCWTVSTTYFLWVTVIMVFYCQNVLMLSSLSKKQPEKSRGYFVKWGVMHTLCHSFHGGWWSDAWQNSWTRRLLWQRKVICSDITRISLSDKEVLKWIVCKHYSMV